jgi:RND superfamily putative drug exporter
MLHLARLSIRRPVAALLVCGLLAAGLTLVGLGVSDELSPSKTTVAGSQSSHAQELAESEFGPSTLVPILLEGPKQQLDRQGPALVRELSKRPDTRVMSAWDGGDIGAALRPETDAAMLVAAVAKTEEQMVETTQDEIDATINRVVNAPVNASVSGTPTIDQAMKDEAIDTARRGLLLTLPILFIVALLLLRAPVVAAALAVLGTATAFSALGVMALLGKVIDVDAVAVTSAIMIGLGLGVGYGLLFYRRWRSELIEDVAHHDAAHAATVALQTTGRSVLVGGTALIVALLIAPMIADQDILTSIGVGALLCSVLSVGAAVVVMPAFLVLAGDRSHALSFAAPQPALRGWERMVGGGNWVIRHAVWVGAAATLGLAALAIPLLSLDTGPPSVKYLPEDNQARVDYERIAHVMGPGYPTPYNIVVVSDKRPLTEPALLRELARLQDDLADDKRVAGVAGPGDFAATSKELSILPKKLKESTALLKGGKKQLGVLEEGLGTAAGGVVKLQKGLTDAASGAGQLSSGSGAAQSGAGQLRSGLASASSGADQIAAGLTAALTGAKALQEGAGKALSGSQQISGGLGQAVKPVQAGAPIVKTMADDIATSAGAVKGAQGATDQLAAQLDEAAAAVEALPASAAKSNAAGAIGSAQQAAGGLSSSLSDTSAKLGQSAGIAGAFADQVQQLSSGLAQLYAGSTALTGGISELQAGNTKLAQGIGKLSGGGSALSAGLVKLRDGAGQLESGLSRLTGGAGQLASGLSGATGPTGQLATGLQSGEAKVAEFRTNLPSPEDLERLQEQSPGLFDSGYFVLAAIAGASPTQQSQASFAVNLRSGGNAGQITVFPAYAMDDERTMALGDDLQDRVAGWADITGVEAAVGGPAGSLNDFTTASNDKIAPVIIITAIVVALLMMALLRTVVLPIVAVAFDLLVAAATFGILTLLFQGDDPVLGGPGYLDPISIIAVFAAVFGLTMVYEVHLLHRTREAFVESGDPHEALRSGLRQTAAAGTGAGLAMVAAFAPFAASELITVRQLALGLGIAVLLDALLVRPVLLPAAVEVLGRRSWWPTSRAAPTPPSAAPPSPSAEPPAPAAAPPSLRERPA